MNSLGGGWRVCLLTVALCWAGGVALPALAQEAPVSIEVGHFMLSSKTVQPWFMREVAAFMQAHPGIEVTVREFNQPDRGKTLLMDTPNLAANVIGISSWAGYETQYLASRNLIVPIDKFLPDPEFKKEDFYPALFASAQYRGKTWGAPLLSTPLLLAYRIDLFEAEGLKHPPATWAEFVEVGTKLTKDTNGDGVPEQFGFRQPDAQALGRTVWTRLMQDVGHVFNEQGLDLSNTAFRSSLKSWQEICAEPFFLKLWMVPSNVQPDEHTAMTFAAERDLKRIQKDKRYGLAPLPSDGKPVDVDGDTRYLAIRRSTPEKEKASWLFVKWFTRANAPLAEAPVGYPCRRDVLEWPEWKKLEKEYCSGWEYVFKFYEQMTDVGPQNLVGREFAAARFLNYYATALTGRISLEAALERSAAEANSFVRVLELPNVPAHQTRIY